MKKPFNPRPNYNRNRLVLYRLDCKTNSTIEMVNVADNIKNRMIFDRVYNRIADRIITNNCQDWFENYRYYIRQEFRPLRIY